MCCGNQARSKVKECIVVHSAKDSRSKIWPDWLADGKSFPVGVRRFKSCPQHQKYICCGSGQFLIAVYVLVVACSKTSFAAMLVSVFGCNIFQSMAVYPFNFYSEDEIS